VDMLRVLQEWWLERMRELVPPAMRGRRRIQDAWIISIENSPEASVPTLRLSLRVAARESVSKQFVMDAAGIEAARAYLRKIHRRRPIAAQIPSSVLLERHVNLPMAAESDIGSILRYEMDRITPFGAEEVFWSWSVSRRDHQQRRVHVSICLVPKTALPTLTAALDALDARLAWLEVEAKGGTRSIPVRHDIVPDRRRRWGQLLAAGGMGSLAIIAVVLPFVLQGVARIQVEERIQALEPQMRLAEELRTRIINRASGAELEAAERARTGDLLAVLAAVTTALPDDTFLTDFGLRRRRLEISGQSRTAARLIGLLAASPGIRNPVFTASVTRAENGADVFAIQAEAVP
jgi:general secretion pathway protein L